MGLLLIFENHLFNLRLSLYPYREIMLILLPQKIMIMKWCHLRYFFYWHYINYERKISLETSNDQQLPHVFYRISSHTESHKIETESHLKPLLEKGAYTINVHYNSLNLDTLKHLYDKCLTLLLVPLSFYALANIFLSNLLRRKLCFKVSSRSICNPTIWFVFSRSFQWIGNRELTFSLAQNCLILIND